MSRAGQKNASYELGIFNLLTVLTRSFSHTAFMMCAATSFMYCVTAAIEMN